MAVSPPAEHGEELDRNIRGAIKLQLRGMRQDGVPVLPPSTSAGYADIAA